ncbi:hypothetical protein [Methylobacterium sp. SD21]
MSLKGDGIAFGIDGSCANEVLKRVCTRQRAEAANHAEGKSIIDHQKP